MSFIGEEKLIQTETDPNHPSTKNEKVIAVGDYFMVSS